MLHNLLENWAKTARDRVENEFCRPRGRRDVFVTFSCARVRAPRAQIFADFFSDLCIVGLGSPLKIAQQPFVCQFWSRGAWDVLIVKC